MMMSRMLPSAAALSLLIAGVCIAPVQADAASDPELVDLGTAMEVTDVGAVAAGPDLAGGNLLYVTTSGQPPTFTVLDAETNDVIYQQVMEGDEFLTASVVDTEAGLTYFSYRSGTATQFYVYDVRNNTVEPVLRTCRTCEISKTVFRVFEVASDGTLYMGSYPDATVYSYNPVSGEVRNYGSVFSEGEYIWGLTLAGDQLFVGTGNGPGLGRFFQVDTTSGAITQVPFPEDAVTPNVIGELQVVGDVVLVPMFGDPMHLRMYNHRTQQWVCPGVAAPGFPQPTDAFDSDSIDGKTYFRSGSIVWELEPASCRYRQVFDLNEHGLDAEGFSRVKIVPTGEADDPQLWRLLLFAANGRSLLIDPTTGAYEVRDSNVLPSPVTAQSIGVGPDGMVYIGAYLSPDVMARLDPKTNDISILDGPEQSDSVTTVGDRLVVTSYPNAVVHSGRPDEPWAWGDNPELLFNGSAQTQDRIFDVVDADGLGVLGSVPKYGLLGGALTVFDPVTGDNQVYREPLGEQSVGALTYRHGVAYVGTTVQGGIGADPAPDAEAALFAFDLDSREVTQRIVPVPGAKTIGALAFGRGRHMWGMTDTGVLFKYHVNDHVVEDTVTMPGARGGTNWGRLPELAFNKRDGLFYGISATRQFFSFDPKSKTIQVLDDEHDWIGMEILSDGRVYLIDQSHVFVLDPR